MKLLAYLLLVGKTSALSAISSIVDAASNTTAPTLVTPESSTNLAWDTQDDYDEDYEDSLDKYQQSLDTISAVLDAASGINDALDNKNVKVVLAAFGCALAVMQIVMIFLPKQPSAEERAIMAAVETITKKMDVIHKAQMAELSQLGRNQFFLHAVDKIETLEQLTRVQIAFRNRYNKRAIEFVCGQQASGCSDAFRNWAGALTKSLDQLIKDGPGSEWNGLDNLGYNTASIKKQVDLAVKQLKTYPKALEFAISGAAANKQRADKKFPVPDLVSQFFTDEIEMKAHTLLEYIEDNIYPYLMKYEEERVSFGDRGGPWQKRENRLEHMIKGYHQDKNTYLGSITKLIWAHNPSMVHLGTSTRSCWTELDHNGGKCYCYKNTWLRGNRFSTSHDTADYIKHFVPGWEESYCNYFSGWFQENCENIDGEGTSKVTTCPKNKFWVGIKRMNGPGLDQVKYRCCEAVYAKPLTGADPLPAEYKDGDGKVSFQSGDVFLRMHDEWADMKSKTHGGWERFTIVPVMAEKGLYKLINHQGAELSCFGPDDERLGRTDKSIIHKEFQFIEKDGGYAIYNPHMHRFVGRKDDGDAGCLDKDFKSSTVFVGPKKPMAVKYRLPMAPNLFKTEMTAPGEQAGWGFKRTFTSKWYAFLNHDQGRWLKADKNDVVMGHLSGKPGAWEKFEIQQIGARENAVFALKSFHGKYIRCMPDGSIKADHADKPYDWEKFIIYQERTNSIKFYNPTHGRYIIMSQDGAVHCNEPNSEYATEWGTPSGQ